MTRHPGISVVCASLVALCAAAAWAQPYPTTDASGQAPTYVAGGARVGSGSAAWGGAPVGSLASGADDSWISAPCERCQQTECACRPHWAISADLLWMSRSRANSQTMIESPLGGAVISESFNARELLFESRAGFRASLGYDLMDGRAFELTTLNVFDQPAHADVADTDMFFTFHGLSPAIATDAYTIDYVSNLHSGELNWWLDECWGIRPMVGARWLRVREEFSILDTTDTSWDATSRMRNDLFGAQIGFKTRLFNGGNWLRLETAMKSGLYLNAVDYSANVVDAAGVSQGSINRSPSAASFVGEITVAAVMQCCPWLALRCGYHGLWMSEIALAPNQANRSAIATGLGPNHFGGLNYQGGFMGLEANW